MSPSNERTLALAAELEKAIDQLRFAVKAVNAGSRVISVKAIHNAVDAIGSIRDELYQEARP